MKFNNHPVKIYIFIDSFNSLIEKKIQKIKNILGIIYENQLIPSENFFKIKKFCKRNKIKLYILDDYRKVIKYKLNGLVVSSYNKAISNIQNGQFKKNNIEILGKAHNQLEFYQKKMQSCSTIFLSPIFITNKYSKNKILGISKFNLISLNWSLHLIALGGVKLSNFKEIKMTRSVAVGIKSFIEN
jgi:thiamine-phosphate pyrophosphorylase